MLVLAFVVGALAGGLISSVGIRLFLAAMANNGSQDVDCRTLQSTLDDSTTNPYQPSHVTTSQPTLALKWRPVVAILVVLILIVLFFAGIRLARML